MRSSQLFLNLLFVASTACASTQIQAPVAPVATTLRAATDVELETVEQLINEGAEKNAGAIQRALLSQARLMDRTWGGVYSGDASADRHAKRTLRSAEIMRLSALAYRTYGTKKLRDIAESIERHLETFLRAPDGSFYAGQSGTPPAGVDADKYFALSDEARRAYGVPEIDRRVLPLENARVVRALVTLHDVTGDEHALELAEGAMTWLMNTPSDDAAYADVREAKSLFRSLSQRPALIAFAE